MGAFSGKFMGDPGAYTFQQVIDRVAAALDKVQEGGALRSEQIQIEMTIRGPDTVDTIRIPTESIREAVEILKLNGS
ncbi:hypothetical protein [Sphingomonas crusticola]|uniref:hypothetical protein n=1 Tax=Sphingomonas crusticola TaxID=1697973 RepID=UPI0013C2B166|nr:hypothetical protein [Sphingomonas crusticola]